MYVVFCREKVVVLQETGSHALMELARQANLMGLPHFLVDDTNKTQVRQIFHHDTGCISIAQYIC